MTAPSATGHANGIVQRKTKSPDHKPRDIGLLWTQMSQDLSKLNAATETDQPVAKGSDYAPM